MSIYSGFFDVENNDFKLKAERFIIRENEVAFHFEGSDESGGFEIEGTAIKKNDGFYFASNLDLKYFQDYTSQDEASIKIVVYSSSRTKCRIEGVWIQDRIEYKFSGELTVRKA